MKDLLESAARAHSLIVPPDLLAGSRVNRRADYPRVKIQIWVTEKVLPAIAELWPRARFRETATWPQRAFGQGKSTPEMQLVGEVTTALRQSARDVFAVAMAASKTGKVPTLEQAELLLNGPEKKGSHLLRKDVEKVDTALALVRCNRLCKHEPDKLVSVDDYFGPFHDSGYVIDGKFVTNGMFLPFVNPRQKHLGNHVVRCLITRVQIEHEALERLRRVARPALDKKRRETLLARENESWQSLTELTKRLEGDFLTSPVARIRESCMTLVQVYLDWANPRPDTDWLQLGVPVLATNRGITRHQLTSGSDYFPVEQLASALREAQRLYRDAPPDQEAIEEAIAAGGLVVVEGRQEVYWQGKPVRKDWQKYSAPWEFLWLLAKRGRSGQPIQMVDLYPDEPAGPRSTMSNRWRRLKERLPPSLRSCIRPVKRIRSSYRLQLDSHLIHLFPVERRIAPATA